MFSLSFNRYNGSLLSKQYLFFINQRGWPMGRPFVLLCLYRARLWYNKHWCFNCQKGSVMTYTHLLFDLDHTLLDFDRAEDLALTFLLEEAGVASQEIKVYKDHYIPMNRAMWEDLNHGLITKPELLRTRFSRLFEHFGKEVDGSFLAGRYQHFLSQQGQELPQAHAFLADVKDRGHKIYAATNGVSFITWSPAVQVFYLSSTMSSSLMRWVPTNRLQTFLIKIANQVHWFSPKLSSHDWW